MTWPGFTAEASLYDSGNAYGLAIGVASRQAAAAIVPQVCRSYDDGCFACCEGTDCFKICPGDLM